MVQGTGAVCTSAPATEPKKTSSESANLANTPPPSLAAVGGAVGESVGVVVVGSEVGSATGMGVGK